MKLIKKMIERIFTKKNIKIFLLVFVVLWFFIWSSFAQTSETAAMTGAQKVGHLLRILISILSWVWVLLATLAWKLMTNDFVYGSFLHLDRALWQLWNIMKNFANFTLWFILLFTIVKNLFKWSFGSSEGDPIKAAKDTIIHTLIAWVLVQMSWFLMAAMLDLSTIATAAVWALPSQFMASSTSFQNNMKSLITTWSTQKLVIDFSTNGEIVDAISTTGVDSEEDLKKFFDTIMPNTESMAWTLVFLWASVFDLYDLSDSSQNLSWTDDIWDLLLSLWINWFVLLAFSLMMTLIFVFNLFRVITLWIIIPLLPFIVVLAVFSKWKNSKITWFLGDIVNYEKILKLVFKPVYMTLVLSIVLIVMVLVRALAKANGGFIDLQEQNNLTVQSQAVWSGYDSSLDIANIATVRLNMKESLVDLMVYIMGIALMFLLMKSCVSGEITWIKFIDEKINNLSSAIWWADGKFWWILWSVWVIPVWGGKKVSLSKMAEFGDRFKNDWSLRANAVWIDVEKQDKLIEERLRWWSFSTLSPSLSKEEWIKKAVNIWKRSFYRAEDMYVDGWFQTALTKWIQYDSINRTQVSIDDIKNVWNPKEEQSTTSNSWSNKSWKSNQWWSNQSWNNSKSSTPQQTKPKS